MRDPSSLPFVRVPRTVAFPVLIVAVALLALPTAVSATAPVVETFHTEGTFSFAGPCPNGVTLLYTIDEVVRVTTFFDRAGNPVREVIKVDRAGEVTNPATGESIGNPAHVTYFVDLVDGTETEVGLFITATVPGVGVVFHDVGRVVFDADGRRDLRGRPPRRAQHRGRPQRQGELLRGPDLRRAGLTRRRARGSPLARLLATASHRRTNHI
jgi:hypothetical protein